MKRVLVDRHHSDLYHSLQLLGDRLGWLLYTPVGREWWDQGYWRFGHGYGDDRLVRQFLEGDWQRPWDGSVIWETTDRHHPDRPVMGVELKTVLATPSEWAYVIATVEDNQPGFRRLADEIGAKYVVQVGNTRQTIEYNLNPILIDSAQEFDYTGLFAFREPVGGGVTSFVNLLPLIPEAWQPFEDLRTRLPEVEFRSFGHNCPDGFRDPISAVADEMALADWAYHDKVTGDGFGHVIHNWAAIGRPLIGHARFYEGQRAEPLWVDGVTCIDLDRHSIDEAAEIIRSISTQRHREMCRAIRAVFETIYDPAADAARIAGLLA